MRKLPRVLICAPTSDRHSYCIKRWMKAVDELRYDKDRYAVCLIDTSAKKGKYGRMLRKWGAKVIDHKWNPKKQHPIQMLAEARELYRQEAWKHKFDYILHLDTDVLIPRNGLLKLLRHNKDQVGFVVHAFYTEKGFKKAFKGLIRKLKLNYSEFKSKPAVFRSGNIFTDQNGSNLPYGQWVKAAELLPQANLAVCRKGYDYYSWEDVKRFQKKKQPVRVYASSIACLLVKKKVYSSVPFRTHPTFVYGEDMWYYEEADAKGFEAWCDTSVRCVHLNANWEHVHKSKPKLSFQIGIADSFHPVWDDVKKAVEEKKAQVALAEVKK